MVTPMSAAPAHAPDAPTGPHVAAPFRCANCGRKNQGEFCAGCGQKRIHPGDLSLGHAWHHIVHELLHLDGKVFGSLKLLFTRPGQLTLDFIQGRRARHVHPIRLFLVFSFAYFFFGEADWLRRMPEAVRQAVERSAIATTPAPHPNAASGDGAALAADAAAATGHSARLGVQMREGYRPFYKGVLIASFLFTGVLYALFFRARRLFLAEHMVMALHLACIAMLWGLLSRALNSLGLLGDWVLVPELFVFVIYPALAARRVYGGGWPGIVAKVTAVSILAKAAYVAVVLGILALLPVLGAPAATATEAPAATQKTAVVFAPDATVAEVPFDLAQNNPLVRVRINGSDPIWMVLDTGAGVNVLDAGLAERLGLRPGGGQVHLQGAGSSVTAAVVEGASIALGGVTVQGQPITTVPLANLRALSGRPVHGLIGTEFLQHFVVEIDYARRLARLHRPQHYRAPAGVASLPIRIDSSRVPVVEAELAVTGGKTLKDWFMIDSGSHRIFELTVPFARTHRVLEAVPPARQAEGIGGAGVGGDVRYVEARVESIRFGPHELRRPVVSVAQAAAGIGASEALAGLVGTGLLRRFTVTIDYPGRRMLLEPNASLADPFEVDMSGIELTTTPDDHSIVSLKKVRANFPAAEAGLREGDVLVALDGRPAAELGLSALVEMFKVAGQEYRLTLRRGAETFERTLKLRRAL